MVATLAPMPSLGVPIKVDQDSPSTKFRAYLRLADSLDCKTHPESDHLKELSASFAHDVLNIAALAGRLLWHEGVTPEMWRSHDLIAVGVDVEAYYVMLQSACDTMADAIATLGAKKKGQVPRNSFHHLNEWAQKHRDRLDAAYHLVAAPLPWFTEINSTRTGIVHHGQRMLIYTDRVTFNWGTLIPTLRSLTGSMLDFSEQLGDIVVPDEERKKNTKKVIIEGVYVPALRHLLHEYSVPGESQAELRNAARLLIACGGYVEAAYIDYPKGFWWEVLMSSSTKLASEVITAIVPVRGNGSVFDSKFVFSDGAKTFGLIACDRGRADSDWLEGAAKSLHQLGSQYTLGRGALVVRKMEGTAPLVLAGTDFRVIVGTDATEVTTKLVCAMQT